MVISVFISRFLTCRIKHKAGKGRSESVAPVILMTRRFGREGFGTRSEVLFYLYYTRVAYVSD